MWIYQRGKITGVHRRNIYAYFDTWESHEIIRSEQLDWIAMVKF